MAATPALLVAGGKRCRDPTFVVWLLRKTGRDVFVDRKLFAITSGFGSQIKQGITSNLAGGKDVLLREGKMVALHGEGFTRIWFSLGCDRKVIRKKKWLVETSELVTSPAAFSHPAPPPKKKKMEANLFCGSGLRRHFLVFVFERARMSECVR